MGKVELFWIIKQGRLHPPSKREKKIVQMIIYHSPFKFEDTRSQSKECLDGFL